MLTFDGIQNGAHFRCERRYRSKGLGRDGARVFLMILWDH